MTKRRSGLRNLVIGGGGFAVGAIFLWLALRQFDRQQFSYALATFDRRLLIVAGIVYWTAFACRVMRWHLLLRQLRQVPRLTVAEALVVGYAVNNLLPARLGELFRADYAKRRLGLTRSTLLGSIVIERLLDLCVILACLVTGLALVATRQDAARLHTFLVIAGNALVLALVGAGVVVLLVKRGPLRGGSTLARAANDLRSGLATLNPRSAAATVGLSLAIWMAELFALGAVFLALDMRLAPGQVMLLLGAASLSTLVPTAPGYLGTYQFVFVLAMQFFGLPETVGLVASVLVQVCLFGSVTIVGLGWYLGRTYYALRAHSRTGSVGAG